MLRQTRVILGIFILGIFFVVLSLYFSRSSYFSNQNQSIKLGSITRETGSLEIIKAGLQKRSKIDATSDVFNFDSIETSEIGEANLTLENGYRLRIFGNSLITLEQINEIENFRTLLTLKRGDIRIDQIGRSNELYISKNGIQTNAETFNNSELQKAPMKLTKENSNIPDRTVLTEEEITSTMSNHKNSFYKCYSRLLQKKSAQKGDVTLTFMIDNSGHTSDLNIDTPIKDEDFTRCLRDVVGRIEFKPFTGPQISAYFPLKFD
jgi:hypothetical protein